VARFRATIPSTLSQEEAFAYLAAFEHAAEWDPTVREASRVNEGELRLGSRFRVVSTVADLDVALVYEITRLEPPRLVVLEASQASISARDSFSVEPDGEGSVVGYEATLELRGVRRLLEPATQAAFDRSGRAAETSLRARLNPTRSS
jgi:polyketide cyclase/dehydrase/lipid transport protein